MQEKELVIVKELKQIISKRIKVHDVIVFGSRARGNATEESDLDVLVVVDTMDRSIEKYIGECAWEIGFPNDIVITPIAITFDTLKNSPIRESAFIKNVYREGVHV
ncbi:MAG: nucleotidyltransferase domain-containing protein [Candidatus Brocadiaceae bacterium]|nr:nucleotidyltransferase domain-containing protein [Candidatus Brocadiaceae bacterium]